MGLERIVVRWHILSCENHYKNLLIILYGMNVFKITQSRELQIEILSFGLLCFLLGFTIKNGATLLFSRNHTILLPIFLFSKISICSQSRLVAGFVAILSLPPLVDDCLLNHPHVFFLHKKMRLHFSNY